MKILENFGNLLKFLETSETVQNDFEIFGKSAGVFRNFRKTLEMVQKCFFRCFYDFQNFRKIFRNLWKCSKIIGKFPDMIGNVCNGSQELKSFGTGV